MTAAGDRYDAAVREVWAGVDSALSTREAWALARPGMVAAQQQMDADLAEARLQGGEAAQRVITAQASAGMTPDQVEASAERVLGGRLDQPGPAAEAFYGEYDTTAAMLTAELREMEAGG